MSQMAWAFVRNLFRKPPEGYEPSDRELLEAPRFAQFPLSMRIGVIAILASCALGWVLVELVIWPLRVLRVATRRAPAEELLKPYVAAAASLGILRQIFLEARGKESWLSPEAMIEHPKRLSELSGD